MIALSPSGRIFVTRNGDEFQQSDVETGKELGRRQAPYPVFLVAFVGERAIGVPPVLTELSGLWDVTSGQLLGSPLTEPTGIISDFAFTPDGKGILVGSQDRRTTQLSDTATGKPIGPPLVHTESAHRVHVCRDGRRILSCSQFGRILSMPTPRPLEGTPERIRCWIEVLTGARLDERGAGLELKAQELDQRRQMLRELGGSPEDADHP